MLCLTRNKGERVMLSNGVTIVYLGRGMIGIDAPREVRIDREELLPADDPRRGARLPKRRGRCQDGPAPDGGAAG